MAVRYPLIVDTTDNNKIKELPSGDSLNLSGNNIVNVVNVTASGTLTVQNLAVESTTFTVDGNSLNSVAFTGSYTDLSNTPTLFNGAYASLTGKPSIPANIEDLANVGSTSPANGEILIYDSTLGRYEPGTINASFDAQFQDQNIDNLNNVVFTGDKTNDVLKFVDGIWKNERVDFDELTGTLNVVQQGDTFTGSLIGDVQGSIFADDSTLLVDSVNNIINLDGTVKGDIIPDTNVAYDIGSDTKRFKDLYLSGDTINLGGTALSIVAGKLQVGGTDVGATTLGALSDVNNTAPSWNNQPLVWDGSSEWKPAQDLFVDDLKAFTKLTLDGQGTYIEWIGNLNPPFYTIKLNITGNATQNETITLPNATGTVALTSDIPAGTTINNNADNRIITGSNTANTLNADGNFTWNGTAVNLIGNIIVGGTISGGNTTVSGDLNFYNDAGSTLVGRIKNDNDRLEFHNDSNRVFYFSATDTVFETDVFIPQYIKHDGDTDTFFGFGGANYLTASVGGTQVFEALLSEFNIPNFNVGIGNTDPQEKLDVTGNIVASGTITANTFSGNVDDATVTTGLSFGNLVKANFGDSDELQIFSNSSQAKSFIKTDTNTLTLSTNNKVRIQNSGGFGAFEADVDGSTDLYYNLDKKFETTNTGVAVTGDITATGNITGDVTGSVFADDSTLLVDAVSGEIPGYVKIADLKTALQDGAGDYAAFKAWVLANL